MTDPRDARSKAEASYRLAELAKTPRARELFKQLAGEYEAAANGEVKHESIAPTEVAPSLVPIAAPAADEPAASLAPAMATMSPAPAAPLSESEQWIADLKAAREAS